MVLKLAILLLLTQFSSQVLAATDKVICYYVSKAARRTGNGNVTADMIDPNLCTHINFGFFMLHDAGFMQVADLEIDINQGEIRKTRLLKQQNPDLKILLSVGGFTTSSSLFSKVVGDAKKREVLAENAVEWVVMYGYDGLDVAWEYPGPSDKENFVKLLSSLRTNLNQHNLLLTVAVNSIPAEAGGYDIPAISNLSDVINVMTYDFHGAWSPTAHHAPLYAGAHESAWIQENRNADGAIKHWIDGGAAPEKIAMGVPFYGRTYTLLNPLNNGIDAPAAGLGEPGKYTETRGKLGYNEICEFHSNGTTVFQEDMKVPYMYDGEFWIGYENEQSVALKVQYAKEKKLAGVTIWSVDTDDVHGFCGKNYGLLKAINEAL